MKANRRIRDLRRRPKSKTRKFIVVEGVKAYVTTQPTKDNRVQQEAR